MKIIGKEINYIQLHNFLERIEVDKVYSSLHVFYTALTSGMDQHEEIEWAGRKFTKLTLLSIMREEEGVLNNIVFSQPSEDSFEITLNFVSGNELVINIKQQEQFIQILQFIAEYSK